MRFLLEFNDGAPGTVSPHLILRRVGVDGMSCWHSQSVSQQQFSKAKSDSMANICKLLIVIAKQTINDSHLFFITCILTELKFFVSFIYTRTMEILMISDTHGNRDMIESMLPVTDSVDLLVHLGDDYRDALPFIEAGFPTIRVPGTWGAEYQDPLIDNRRFEDFLGWRFFLTHTPTKDSHDLPNDMDPNLVIHDQECHVFCHGHTHEPKISKYNDVVILNPGHLKSHYDRGFDASYAKITISELICHIRIIHQQTTQVIDELKIERNQPIAASDGKETP